MSALLMLAAFMGGQAQAAVPGDRKPVSIAIVTRSAFSGGEQKEISRLVVPDVRQPKTVYVYTPSTVCEPSILSEAPPEKASYAWAIEIVPSTTDQRASLRWRRVLHGGVATKSAAGSRDVVAGRMYGVLDSVDGGSRLEIQRKLAALRNTDPDGPDADRLPEISADPQVMGLRGRMAAIEGQVQEQKVHGRLDNHPDVRRLQQDLTQLRAELRSRKSMILTTLLSQYESATVPLRPIDGCNALSMTLEAGITRRGTADVIEAELWFIHRTPDGKETTQRQAVRMRDGGRGDFYFEDLKVDAAVGGRTEPVTIEVFGSINTGTMMDDGEINMQLQLTRRYINASATALNIPPNVGRTVYPLTVRAAEVVSFVLPPLDNDQGQLLGHRFSLRLRLKPLDRLEAEASGR